VRKKTTRKWKLRVVFTRPTRLQTSKTIRTDLPWDLYRPCNDQVSAKSMTMMMRVSTNSIPLQIWIQTFDHAVAPSPVKSISRQKWNQKHSWLGKHKYRMRQVIALLSCRMELMIKISKSYCL
jgi:hypothetical protein